MNTAKGTVELRGVCPIPQQDRKWRENMTFLTNRMPNC